MNALRNILQIRARPVLRGLLACLCLSLSALPQPAPAAPFDVIINEMSQGPSGSKEWVEILVKTNALDMRGWQIGENNGGVWSTYSTFSTHASWSSVACGTLIVIYNGADKDTNSLPVDDTNFGDKVVVIPHNNSTYFNPVGSWSGFGNTDRDDCPAIRDASLNMIHDMAGTHPTQQVGSPTAGNHKRYMEDSTAEIFTDANWTQGTAATATPGAGNGGNNTAWVTNCSPPAQQKPTITVPGPQAGSISNNLKFGVTATEPDGQTVTLTASNMPAGAIFSPTNLTGSASGTFSFTPPYATTAQIYSVTFWASDINGSTQASVTITIQPPSPPVLTFTTSYSIVVSNTLKFQVVGTDLDGDFVSLTASNLPAGSGFFPTNDTSTARGTFSFTPSSAQSGQVYNVMFNASDKDGAVQQSANISVLGAGDVPPAPIAFFNEIRANGTGNDTNEFIELVAPAGVNLQGFYITHHNGADSDGELFRFTFPSFTVPNDGVTNTDGRAVGFVVIGTPYVTNADFSFPGGAGNDVMQNGPDGLVLRDPLNNFIDAIAWGDGAGDLAVDDPGGLVTTGTPYALNYLSATIDDDNGQDSLQSTNNVSGNPGGTMWSLRGATPGAINLSQNSGRIVMNTNPPPPVSHYSKMSLIGDYNGFAITSNMTLVADNTWMINLVNINSSTNRFKFNPNSAYSSQFGENNQTDFTLPVNNQLAESNGSDIVLIDNLTGFFTFTLNDTSLLYSVTRGEPSSLAVAGSFNGWNKTPNLTRAAGSTWEGTFVVNSTTGIQFKFVANDDWSIAWGQTNQSDFDLPMIDISEVGGAAVNISLPGNLVGSYKFVFDHSTLQYTITAVSNSTITFVQDFDEWPTTSGYGNFSFEGWSVFNAFIDTTKAMVGQVCRIRNTTATGTDLFLQSPQSAAGLGYVSFWYANWDGSPATTAIVQKSASGLNTNSAWITVTNITVANTGYVQAVVLFNDLTNYYFRIQRGGGLERLLIDDVFFSSSTNVATVSVGNVRTDPTTPFTNDSVHILADITPLFGATDLQPKLYYRVAGNTNVAFTNISMNLIGTKTYQTTTPIPPKPIGTLVEYYILVAFEGPGSDSSSPYRYPGGGATLSYGIPRNSPERVWINEINYAVEFFESPVTNEFIEIAGPATTDISGWSIQLVDLNEAGGSSFTVYDKYTFTNGTLIPNDVEGYGFKVLGSALNPMSDLFLTNSLFDHRIGGVRLLNEYGGLEHAVSYDGSVGGEYDYAQGVDNDLLPPDNQSISLVGVGTAYDDFDWVVNSPSTPGTANGGTNGYQVFQLVPILTASNLSYTCTADVPSATSYVGVFATGTCNDLTATLSFIGPQTNNGGQGCVVSPLLIYRTYQAVSSCQSTSRVTQVITVIDNVRPSINEGTLAFDPRDIPGLALWLDASDATTVQHTALSVTNWLDKTTNGNNLVQGVSTQRPTLVSNQLNNQPMIRFDGTNDVLYRNSALGLSSNPALTVFVVSRLSGSNRLLCIGASNGNGRTFQLEPNSSWQINGDRIEFTNAPVNDDSPHIAAWAKDTDEKIATFDFFKDGIPATATSSGLGTYSFTETFESGDFASNGWTNQNSDAQITAAAAYAGAYGASLKRATFTEKSINTVGLPSITVSYARRTVGYEPGEFLYVEVWNGTNWSALEATAELTWQTKEWVLPTDCGNNPSFKIRFRTNASSSTEFGYVDSVVITSDSGVYPDLANHALLLGAGYSSTRSATTPDSFIRGDFAEILVYKSQLSPSEMEAIGYFLEAKWGLNTAYAEPEDSSIYLYATNCTIVLPDYRSSIQTDDQCSTPVVTQTPAPGSSIPAGINTVTIQSKDACSNLNSISFDVIVVGTAAPTISGPSTVTTECHTATYDNASEGAYFIDGWQNGDAGGTGWGTNQWILSANDGFSGQFVGDSRDNGGLVDSNGDGDINSVGVKAWAMYASGGRTSTATRVFDYPLWQGHTFSIQLDNGFVNSGGQVGFALQTKSSNVDRIRFAFHGGETNYVVYDSLGKRNTGVPYTDQGVLVRIQLTSLNTYRMEITRIVNDAFYVLTGTFTGAANTDLNRVRLFNGNAGSGSAYDLFFNRIHKDTVPPEEPKLVSVSGACYPMNIFHLSDTTTGSCPEVVSRIYLAEDEFGGSLAYTQRILVADTRPPTITTATNTFTMTKGPAPDFTTNAVASDTCASTVSFSQIPLEGVIMQEGTQTVFIVATDDCGNSSTGTITVIVVNPPPEVEVVKVVPGSRVTVISTGTNTLNWMPIPYFTTNHTPANWIPVLIFSNVYFNGTNTLTFDPPTINSYFSIRVINQK